MNKVLLNIFSRWTRFLWIPLVVMMHTPLCHAQEVRLEAEISSTKITLDGSLQLTLTVYNHKNAEPIVLPAIEGFDANYRGQSSRVSIVNGQYSNSVSFTYVLYPQKTGQFTIPAIVTEIEGQTLEAQHRRALGGIGDRIEIVADQKRGQQHRHMEQHDR